MLYATALLESRPSDVAAEAVKAVDLGFDDPGILVRGAHLLLTCGEVEAARKSAVRARAVAQSDFVLLSDLINLEGLLAADEGHHDVAEEKLRLAVERQPANGPFAIDLARCLAARGRHSEAREVLDRALKLTKRPDNLERVRAEIPDP